MHPMAELAATVSDFRDVQVVRDAGTPGHERLAWAKRAVYQVLDRSVHRTGFVPAGDAHWWHVSNFERAIVTDMGEQGFRVRTRDRSLALAMTKRSAKLLRRFISEGPAAAQQYRERMGALTSRANWARLYAIEE